MMGTPCGKVDVCFLELTEALTSKYVSIGLTSWGSFVPLDGRFRWCVLLPPPPPPNGMYRLPSYTCTE